MPEPVSTTTEDSRLFQSKVTEKLPMVVGGKGINITLEDPYTKKQTTVIDGSTGAAVGSLGHGNTKIINEIKEMVGDCFYSFTTRVSNYHAEELSRFLCEEQCPPGVFESAVFCSSGSEANELNMKILHQYHHELGDFGRDIFISRKLSYHGFTLGCMNLSGTRVDEFKQLMNPTPKVSNIYPYREMLDEETEEQYKDRLLLELDAKFQEVGPSKVVAFVAEPLSSSTVGSCPSVAGYLNGVREICDKYGALLILDEIMCGSGRCGTFCTWEQFMDLPGPDLQSIGKLLGNGFVTISAVLVSGKVKKVFKLGSNFLKGGQTYHSHSFNCRAALAVQKEIKEQKLIANIKKTGNYLGSQLSKNLIGTYKCVGDVRGAGGFWSVEFVKDRETKERFNAKDKIYEVAKDIIFANGIQCMVVGGLEENVGDHLILAPLYTLTMEELDKIVGIFEKSCKELDEYIAKNL